MKIGIAAENRPQEKRVIIRPQELETLTSAHEVLVEKGAGQGIGFADADYEKIGAKIAPREKVYASELVIRIKEPREDEVKLMRPGSILMSMMHLRCRPQLKTSLQKQKLIAIPLENIKDSFGKRKVEALADSGRIGMKYAFKLWGKDPAKAQVKIMGYGNLAEGAIRCTARKLAKLEILNKTQILEMEKHIPGTDILVDALNRPFRPEVEKEPPFVTRKMLKLLKKGSVIVDLASNPENHAPVETIRPTTLDDLYYIVDDIYHTACWGWPGLEPDNITQRYSIQIAPILKEIADCGLKNLEKLPEEVKKAVIEP